MAAQVFATPMLAKSSFAGAAVVSKAAKAPARAAGMVVKANGTDYGLGLEMAGTAKKSMKAGRAPVPLELEDMPLPLNTFASTRYGDEFDGKTATLCVRRATYWDT